MLHYPGKVGGYSEESESEFFYLCRKRGNFYAQQQDSNITINNHTSKKNKQYYKKVRNRIE